jgi:hypothetical protein
MLYENELCQTPIMDIYISERSICCEKVGINCSCFCIEDHQFSTRTLSERKLWLRAISNVKVKLQNRAPTPTGEDLKHYRLAIKEHINTIKATLEGQAPMDALLQRNPRKSYWMAPPLDAAIGIAAVPEKACGADPGPSPEGNQPCQGQEQKDMNSIQIWMKGTAAEEAGKSENGSGNGNGNGETIVAAQPQSEKSPQSGNATTAPDNVQNEPTPALRDDSAYQAPL